MKYHIVFAVVLGLVLSVTVLLPAAQASNFDHVTKVVFNEPVEIPGTILPAGSYWFVLRDTHSTQNIVQIFSPDWSKIYATELTLPAYRLRPESRTEFRFAERPHKGMEALVTWYLPGETGHQFIYSERVEKKLNADTKQNVVAAPIQLSVRPGSGSL